MKATSEASKPVDTLKHCSSYVEEHNARVDLGLSARKLTIPIIKPPKMISLESVLKALDYAIFVEKQGIVECIREGHVYQGGTVSNYICAHNALVCVRQKLASRNFDSYKDWDGPEQKQRVTVNIKEVALQYFD